MFNYISLLIIIWLNDIDFGSHSGCRCPQLLAVETDPSHLDLQMVTPPHAK
jgi:hypothetical protein